jgi:NADH dehydrogenase
LAEGRLTVDEYLTVPGHPDVYACGDVAAVPDLTRAGELTPMTAQHAVRQGRRAARNIAASAGSGRRRPYKHHDPGFVVDLGGTDVVANPLGTPLAGLAAKAVTRGYHLSSLAGNRIRVADWPLDAILPRQAVQLGLLDPAAVPLTAPHLRRPVEWVGRPWTTGTAWSSRAAASSVRFRLLLVGGRFCVGHGRSGWQPLG